MLRLISIVALMVALLGTVPSVVAAEEYPLLEEHLFPPDVVMRFQHAIDLTSEQRERITESVRDVQASVMELEWDLEDATQALVEILGTSRVDEDAALAQAAEVLTAEREIKMVHLGMLIGIKNVLTREQQEELRELVWTAEAEEREARRELETQWER